MVDFAGWEMPVQYSSIVAEHQAVRNAVGLFDISHMGRLEFSGQDSFRFLNFLTTNNVRNLDVGAIQYSLIVNERGGILDDVLVYRFPDQYLMVVNASNREKILKWIEERREDYDFNLRDLTVSHCMVALQGPRAEEILNPLVDIDLKQIRYYRGAGAHMLEQSVLVSRTGYTGEDGFEIIIPAAHGMALWETLMEAGAAHGILPCGLGCRDTLRLEAAMPLYGHEMNEETDPYTAGLGFAVKLDKPPFVGQQSLAEFFRTRTDLPKRVGIELEGKRIAREGALLYRADLQIGRVTSGTFSPTFEKPIAMGSVPAEFSAVGTAIEVDLRGSRVGAKVVGLPFYRRGK